MAFAQQQPSESLSAALTGKRWTRLQEPAAAIAEPKSLQRVDQRREQQAAAGLHTAEGFNCNVVSVAVGLDC